RWSWPRRPARARPRATLRRRRGRGGLPRRRASAAHGRAACARSAPEARSGGQPQPALLTTAPFDPPFAVVEAPAVDEVDERRAGPGAVVEALQVLEHQSVTLTPAGEQAERIVGRERVGEEQAQQRLVAHLDPCIAPGEPAVQRLGAGLGDAVDAPSAAASGSVVAGDPACLLEPLQLRVDLPVARCPEVPDRPVDHTLDVVAAAGAERDQAQHGPRDCVRLVHTATRYITKMYSSSARMQAWRRRDS